MESAVDLWREANASLPIGWTLQGLRCASTGLIPMQRSDEWIAEACGPNGECERVMVASGEGALRELTLRLRAAMGRR